MVDAQNDDSVDLGLLNVADDLPFEVPDSPQQRRLSVARQSRRPSTSTQDLEERQYRNRPAARLRTHSLTRSHTLPRSFPKSPVREKSFLPLELYFEADIVSKLRRWILCIVVVNFDLDQGPVIDGICPTFPLSAAEKENISFSSFPDSFRHEEGSQIHTFRIRESIPSKSDEEAFDYSARTSLRTSDGFIYGFCYFSRKRDESSSRGYDQRSFIILTQNPWPAFYSEVVKRLGPMYLAHGEPMLESACHNIAGWQDPTPGSTHELGFLGYVLNVELPNNFEQQQSTETRYFKEKFNPQLHILASVAPIVPSPLALFASTISHIWSIWECILLGEPLLILGQSPAMTSQAIWWFIDVLRPIPYAGDFRPYFTIHDKDYRAYVNKNKPGSGLLLGVTNPLFENLCKHWPHKLVLGDRPESEAKKHSHKSSNIPNLNPGWETKSHNRYISKDRILLKHLETVVKAGSTLGNIDSDGKSALLLRQHFTTRSVQFLVPLNRYLNTLIPMNVTLTPSNSSSIASSSSQSLSQTQTHPVRQYQSALRPFNQDDFFASLRTHGSPLPFRTAAKQRDFYERWLRTPAFGLWMAKQEERVNEFLSKPLR